MTLSPPTTSPPATSPACATPTLGDDGEVELIINQGRTMSGLPYGNAVPTIIRWDSPDGLTTRSELTRDYPKGGATPYLPSVTITFN